MHATLSSPITENIPDIPHNKFNFLEFDQLWPRVNVNEILTDNILCLLCYFYEIIILHIYINNFMLLLLTLDIIGVLTSVHPVEEINVQEWAVLKRTLTVQNIRYIKTINILLLLLKVLLFRNKFFTSFIQFCHIHFIIICFRRDKLQITL